MQSNSLLLASQYSFIALLANTVTAAMSIKNSTQMADYVEQLANNLTFSLLLEEKIDNKLETRVTVLEDAESRLDSRGPWMYRPRTHRMVPEQD